MIPNLSVDELLAAYKEAMGSNIGEVYFHCEQELLLTASYWDQFWFVFGNAVAADLFHDCGGHFANCISNSLLDHVMLSIGRLFDRDSRTISLYKLAATRRTGKAVVDNLDSKARKQIDMRHNVVAHANAEQKTGRSKPLNYGEPREIDALLNEMFDHLENVGKTYIPDMSKAHIIDAKHARNHLRYLYLGKLLMNKIHNSKVLGNEGRVEFDESVFDSLPDFISYPDWMRR